MAPDRIAIVGGGVVGSSIAWHLRTGGFAGEVTVVERDPTYRRASSFLALGGVRQQFGSAANIRLAQHGVRFYERFDTVMRTPDHRPRAWFRQRGYLFLANDGNAARLERRYARQRALGARVERLDVDAVRARVPDLALDDVRFGVFGPDDGYANPREVLAGFRHAAAAAGARYVTGEVTRLRVAGGRVRGVTLAGGASLDARAVVNAAGPFAARLAALADLELPVTPVRQHLFRCALPRRWPYRFPVVVDPGGVHWRHDDPAAPGDPDRIVVARTRLDEPPGENFDCDEDALDERLPAAAGRPRAGLRGRRTGRGLGRPVRDDPRPQPPVGRAPGTGRLPPRQRLQRARADDGPGDRRGAGRAADDRGVDAPGRQRVRPRTLRARRGVPGRRDDLIAAPARQRRPSALARSSS